MGMRGPSSDAITGNAQTVGGELRAVREHLGWALEDIAASLRIRTAYLLAIEEGRIGDLPGTTYAMGFVRTYAASLGLDPDETVQRFKTEAGAGHHQQELHFPAPVPERGVPAGAVVLLGAVIAVAGYIGWYKLSANHPVPDAVQEVPEHLAPLARKEEAKTPVASPPVASATSQAQPSAPPSASSASPAPVPGAETHAAQIPSNGPASNGPAGAQAETAGASPPSRPAEHQAPGHQTSERAADAPIMSPSAMPPASSQPSLAAGQTTPSPGQSPGPDGVKPVASGADKTLHGIVLKASADAWMQVKSQNGTILLNKVMHAGESWAVPEAQAGQGPLLLTTGNAGGTQIVMDGHDLPPLGNNGAVRRNVPLETEALQKAAPSAIPDQSRSSVGSSVGSSGRSSVSPEPAHDRSSTVSSPAPRTEDQDNSAD
ncbi:DNA-binding protein [Granulibacter bethesdensis]|uniref:DNA-binding protein n=2 Tax=Granulibacter bethesdensis TaxID=364410 RepID=A0AAN0RCP9_9PROT|nr:DNA-binding protein [Granulibacter bethesdensis]